jgi:hypothetical protein
MASLSSFLLFFLRVLGERAPVVALSSFFLFFSTALASAAFLASSSLCASPALLAMLDLRWLSRMPTLQVS